MLIAQLTIRFLEARTSRSSTILLRFAPTRITDEHVAVVFDKNLSEFVFRLFIDVFSIVRHNRLGNGGADGVNLSCDTAPLDTNTDIQIREFILSDNKYGFKDFQAQSLWLNVLNGLTIDFDQAATLLSKRHRCCSFLSVVSKKRGKSAH